MSISLGEEFRRVGPEVPNGITVVGYEDVEPLHDLVVQNFVDTATTTKNFVNFERTATAGALFFPSMGEVGLETPNRSVSALLTHDGLIDGWRMLAKVATYSRFAGMTDSKFIYYRIQTAGGEVHHASKAVGFILEKTEVVFEDDDVYERFLPNRVMYEKAMTARDCTYLATTIERATKRAPVRVRDSAIAGYRPPEAVA